MTFTKYSDLSDHIVTNRIPDDDYYNLLLDNAELIVDRAKIAQKQTMAPQLGLTGQTFSLAFKFISAYYYRNSNGQ